MTTPHDPGHMAAEEAAYRAHHQAELSTPEHSTVPDLRAFLRERIVHWQDRAAAAFLRDDKLISNNKLETYVAVWGIAFPAEPLPERDHTRTDL